MFVFLPISVYSMRVLFCSVICEIYTSHCVSYGVTRNIGFGLQGSRIWAGAVECVPLRRAPATTHTMADHPLMQPLVTKARMRLYHICQLARNAADEYRANGGGLGGGDGIGDGFINLYAQKPRDRFYVFYGSYDNNSNQVIVRS